MLECILLTIPTLFFMFMTYSWEKSYIKQQKELHVYKDLFKSNMRSIDVYQNIVKYLENQHSVFLGSFEVDIAEINMYIVREILYENVVFEGGQIVKHPRHLKQKEK